MAEKITQIVKKVEELSANVLISLWIILDMVKPDYTSINTLRPEQHIYHFCRQLFEMQFRK